MKRIERTAPENLLPWPLATRQDAFLVFINHVPIIIYDAKRLANGLVDLARHSPAIGGKRRKQTLPVAPRRNRKYRALETYGESIAELQGVVFLRVPRAPANKAKMGRQ
jgi:hypothetical protein